MALLLRHKARDQKEAQPGLSVLRRERGRRHPHHWHPLVPTGGRSSHGRPSDPECLSYGFINVIDLLYLDRVNAARQIYRRIEDLKFGERLRCPSLQLIFPLILPPEYLAAAIKFS